MAAIIAIVLLRRHAQRKRAQHKAELHGIPEAKYQARQKYEHACNIAEMASPPDAVEAGSNSLVEAAGTHLIEADSGAVGKWFKKNARGTSLVGTKLARRN